MADREGHLVSLDVSLVDGETDWAWKARACRTPVPADSDMSDPAIERRIHLASELRALALSLQEAQPANEKRPDTASGR